MYDFWGIRKRFINTAKRQGWFDAPGIVAALSGGGDSVAQLWLLKEFFPGKVVAAHLDHCTREGESHKDASFSVGLCNQWGIECRVKSVEVGALKKAGESFEMAGRRERYAHFCDTADELGIEHIAVGHSADDLIETQLMNLFRGTGLTGLRGIPETRGRIVRPIIDFRRDELRGILTANGVPWREDASNADRMYARNRVRMELIPWLRENLNPNVESALLGLARQAAAETEHKLKRAGERVGSVSVPIYPALACWTPRDLCDFDDTELSDMLRLQGKLLGLPVLSRDRTSKLLALIRKGGCWRFQWALDIEVCYSDRGMGWLHRGDIRRVEEKNQQIPPGKLLPWWAR